MQSNYCHSRSLLCDVSVPSDMESSLFVAVCDGGALDSHLLLEAEFLLLKGAIALEQPLRGEAEKGRKGATAGQVLR